MLFELMKCNTRNGVTFQDLYLNLDSTTITKDILKVLPDKLKYLKDDIPDYS